MTTFYVRSRVHGGIINAVDCDTRAQAEEVFYVKGSLSIDDYLLDSNPPLAEIKAYEMTLERW